MNDRISPRRAPRLPRLAACLTACLVVTLFAACASKPAPEPDPVDPVDKYDMTPAVPDLGSQWTDKPGWTSPTDMIITSHPLATAAGRFILKEGGNAVDAAIAAQLVLALVEPQASGLGGGGFLLYADGQDAKSYDGRETAPAGVSTEMFYGPNGALIPLYQGLIGGRTVGVPGLLRMLELAYREHGHLPWARLFVPAIRLAQNGFPIDEALAARIAADPYLRRDPTARAYFYNADGSPKTAGTVLRNPALAATLRQIAAHGVNPFYVGPIARDIVAAVQHDPTSPGTLGLRDMGGYRAIARAPVCASFRIWNICGAPPPASGGIAVAQIMGMLDALPGWQRFDAQRPIPIDGGFEPTPYAAHVFTEAGRLSYADQEHYIADPDFVAAPGGSWTNLVDPDYLAQRAKLIGVRTMGQASAGSPLGGGAQFAVGHTPELPSGAQITVIDQNGRAVSLSSSLDDQFGARLMVHGFLLNTALTDFSIDAQDNGVPVANRLQPGKRPRSPAAPEIVLLKNPSKVMIVAGSTGGAPEANYVAKTLLGTLAWGMTIQQAEAMPNVGSENGPTEVEAGRVSQALVDGLKGRGHDVRVVPLESGLQGIQRIDVEGQSVWFGGVDPRRNDISPGG